MFSAHRKTPIVRAGLSGAAALALLACTAGTASAQLLDVSNNNVPVADNNQIPVSACNDQVPVNALGVMVPIQEVDAALGIDLLNQEAASPVTQDESCDASMAQENDTGDSAAAGVVQASQPSDAAIGVRNNTIPVLEGNQIPVQACNTQVPVNALGVMVPIDEIKAALGLSALSPDSSSPVEQDDSCDPTLAQDSDVGDGGGE